MREYRPRTVQELAACTCDRCKRRLTPDEPGEWQERLSFDHSCGFDSVFGDCNTVSLDLCQHCAREVLGQWLRITPPKGGDPRNVLRGTAARYDEPTAPVDVEWAAEGEKCPRHPHSEKFPAFGADFMAKGRGEHEQDEREKAARPLAGLKGIIRKPAKPVSVEDMNAAIAEEAGHPKRAKPKKRP